MKFTRNLGLIAVIAALSFAASVPANAAASTFSSKAQMCAPDKAGGTKGPAFVTNPNTSVNYSLDSRGCAIMALADAQYFQTQGFTQGAGTFAIFAGPYTAQSTTANSPTLPANAIIDDIVVQETAGNALTGGLDVGVAGSSDATIVSAYAVGANGVIAVPSASILKRVFPTSGTTGPAAQQVFFNAHTSWNSGKIYVTITYHYF